MGVYGFGVAGTFLYGQPPGVTLDCHVVARATDYGQARVAWSNPAGNWSRMRLVRNPKGFATDADDGALLIDRVGPGENAWQDTGLQRAHRYYYSVFVFSGATQAWIESGTASVLTVDDHRYRDVLYDRLPQVYKTTVLDDITGVSPVSPATWWDVAQYYPNWGWVTESATNWLDWAAGIPPVPGTDLYKLMTLFGFAMDTIRTEIDDVLTLSDPLTMSSAALPAALAQFGFIDNKTLGTRAQRRLVANAADLYAGKGSGPTLEDLTDILTGWASSARPGVNLILDGPDSLTQPSTGRWSTATENCVLVTRADPTVPNGTNYTAIQALTNGTVSASFAQSGVDGRLQAIPVTQGENYTASANVRNGATARMFIDWYDSLGNLLNTTGGATLTPDPADWSVQLTVGIFAPAGSVRAALRITDSLAIGEELWVNSVQFQASPVQDWNQITDGFATWTALTAAYPNWSALEGIVATSWEYPRLAVLRLNADLVNEIWNPNGVGSYGWTAPATAANSWAGIAALYPTWTALTAAFTNWSSLAGLGGGLVYLWGATQTSALDWRTTSAQPVVPVQPGQVWTLAATISAAVDADVCPFLTLYGGEVSVGTSGLLQGNFVHATSTPTQITYTYVVPTDGSVTAIQAGFAFTRLDMATAGALTSGAKITFANVLLEAVNADQIQYFDGSLPSITSDYQWEGIPWQSRSHYYFQRTIKIARLLEEAPQFLPLGVPLLLEFAKGINTGFGPLEGVQNYDTNPAGPPTIIVGATLDIQWRVEQTWDGVTSSYPDWATLAASVATWNALLGLPVISWFQVSTEFVDWDVLTATGFTWTQFSISLD